MSFEIKPATRQGIKPLVGLYAESGCGKTYSSLLLARGMVGAGGKIVMIDTENGRGSLYADVLPGGYDVLSLTEPYSPARYIEAFQEAEQFGAQIIVVDSMSHEHEGIGGMLDMAAENETRSGRPGLHNWKTPKMEHNKLVQRLLRSPVPVICCIRAKYKTRQKKDEKGKTVIVKDEATSPIQSEDFVFEMTAHAEILQNHSIIVTKCSHPSLRECFPKDKTTPITIEHGQAFARWCASPGGTPASSPTAAPKAATEKTRAWFLEQTRDIHIALQTFAIDKGWIEPNMSLEEIPLGKIPMTVPALKELRAAIENHK